MSEIVERFIAEIAAPPPRPVADWQVHANLIASCLRGVELGAKTSVSTRHLLENLTATIQSDQPLKLRLLSVCDQLLTDLKTRH